MSSTSTTQSNFEFWRLAVIYFVVIAVSSLLIIRILNLQIFEATEWLISATKNYSKTVSVPTARGIIYDRNGYVLARNIASYNIVIIPANLPDDSADIQRIYRELSALIDMPVNQGSIEDTKLIAPCVSGPGITQLVDLGYSLAPYNPVKIKCNVGDKTARVVRERSVDLPGVSIEIEPIRDYPTGSLTANVIGFLGPIPASLVEDYIKLGFEPGRDKVGYAGVEASEQDILAGKNGERIIVRDVAGKELRNLTPPIQPVPGNNLRLTIDTRLQEAAEGVLLDEINSWNKYWGQIRISSGTVIAMNPKTGEVLAMVTYPTYENNRMVRFIPAYYYEQLSQDPRHPLLNNAISSEYPPGSVFKLSAATGALNEGVVTLDKIIDAPGQLVLTEKFSPNDPGRERPFVDWNEAGFGQIDYLHCIAYSSNVCFYKLGGGYKDEIPQGLGIERLGEYARAIGYGRPSGIELLGEASGLIPSPQWKRINKGENWSTGDTYIATVGQGYVLSTPLQVIMSGSTIANDGKLMQPTIINEILDSEGNIIQGFIPKMKWDITTDPLIKDYACEGGYCSETDQNKSVQPFVVEKVQEGMRLAVMDPRGTLHKAFLDYPIAVAGKTGTAEYCDDVAFSQNRCKFGLWPTHAWTLAYAPFEDPEIIVLAFAYNGGEGASVAAPIVARVIESYFEIKAIYLAHSISGGG